MSCVGRCDIAPAATVHERPVRAAEVPEAVRAAQADGDDAPGAETAHAPRHWPNDPYDDAGSRYATVRAMIAGALDGDRAIETLKASGCGGWVVRGSRRAPSGRSWRDRTASPST